MVMMLALSIPMALAVAWFGLWIFLRAGSKPVPPTPAEKALMAYLLTVERSGCSPGCIPEATSAKPWPSRPVRKNLTHPYAWLFNQQIDLILQRERVETL